MLARRGALLDSTLDAIERGPLKTGRKKNPNRAYAHLIQHVEDNERMVGFCIVDNKFTVDTTLLSSIPMLRRRESPLTVHRAHVRGLRTSEGSSLKGENEVWDDGFTVSMMG